MFSHPGTRKASNSLSAAGLALRRGISTEAFASSSAGTTAGVLGVIQVMNFGLWPLFGGDSDGNPMWLMFGLSGNVAVM